MPPVSVWSEAIFDLNGRPLPGTAVTIYTDVAGTILAPVFTDATGATPQPGSTYTTVAVGDPTFEPGNLTVFSVPAQLYGRALGQNRIFPVVVPVSGASLSAGYAGLPGTIAAVGQILQATSASAIPSTGWTTNSAIVAAALGWTIVSGPGIDPTGVTECSAAVQAVVNSMANHSVLWLPPGTYNLGTTITLPNGLTVKGAGLGATTLAFSGSGYCLDHPTLDASNGFVIEDMYITCTAASTGAFRFGNFSAAFVNYFGKNSFRNLYLKGPGASVAGTVGFMASQVATSIWQNVRIQDFETGLVMDRTTANTLVGVTIQSSYYGALWTGQSTPFLSGQDTCFYLEVLGPNPGAPADAYSLKVDSGNLTMHSPYFEMGHGAMTAKALVWATVNATGYRENAGRWQPNSSSTNTLIIDPGCSGLVVSGTSLSAFGGAAPASSIGAPGTGGGFNGNHVFIGCDTRLTDTLTAAFAAGYAQAIGQGYINKPGLAPLQIPAILGAGVALPSHIYSQPADAALTASATQDGAVAGTVVPGAGAGTTPPAPVVQGGSNDRRGTISFGTGSVAASGNPVLRVNFSTPYVGNPFIVFSNGNGSSSSSGIRLAISSQSASGFTIAADGGAMPVSQPNTAYKISYFVEG